MTEHLVVVGGLILIGYLLLAVELLVLPGFGFAGIGGMLCFTAGVLLAFRWFGTLPGSLAVILVVASVSGVFAWLPRSPIGRQVVQRETLKDAHSFHQSLAVGAVGVAVSDLRPAGIGRFGERRESVVSDSEFIAAGTAVRVIALEGARVVVEAASPGTEA